jgi:DUF4097 and DUF4098 domain-containing protein YvlB
MAGSPPPYPPPYPPPGFDPREQIRAQRRYMRDQARAQRDAFRAQKQQMRFQMRSMRRGSVLGPMLLIAIGVIFLLIESGRVSHQGFWGWYGHWWPVLLVLAGLIVLAEWALDQYLLRDPQRIPYRRSIGGGVGLLIFFFIAAGLFAGHEFIFHRPDDVLVLHGFQLSPDSLDELFGDKHESDQSIHLTFNQYSALTVLNPHGDVTISGTSDDSHIHIAVHKQLYARSDSDADSRAQQINPTINTDLPNTMTIKVPPLDGARADLVITVPPFTTTTVTANHGDIHVASLKGAVTVTANHGDIDISAISNNPVVAHINSPGSSLSAHDLDGGITIQGHAGEVTLSTISGPVSINGDVFGATHMTHIYGTIHLHTSRTDLQFARLDGEAEISGSGITADQVLGPVVLSTSNRNVSLDRLAGDIAVTNRNGAIDLTAAPALGNITLEDRNGPVRLVLPDHAGFTVQANTSNGEIDSGYALSTLGSGNVSKVLSGTVGAGGPLVRISTTNGEIAIHSGEVAGLAPGPGTTPKITLVPAKPAGHTAKY